jgi:polysaccharide pyruvyl transferase WcaK-like protein
VGELRRADYVVATRFHGALLPLVLEKPVLAIAYHRKSRELLESVGQSDQVIDWRHCELEALQSRFLELERARAAGGTFFRPEILRFRAALELQYDELIAVARSR